MKAAALVADCKTVSRAPSRQEQSMAHFPKPAEGSWTEHYPELGTEPVSYEDSISPEFYELEREAIFKRAVAERRPGRAAPAQGQLLHQGARRRQHVGHRRARHRRRGPRVPQHLPAPRQQAGVERLPAEETSGICRQFTCKYHGWRYDLDGDLTFVQQEGEFFDLDKSRLRPRAGALRRVGGVHLREPRRRTRAVARATSSGR